MKADPFRMPVLRVFYAKHQSARWAELTDTIDESSNQELDNLIYRFLNYRLNDRPLYQHLYFSYGKQNARCSDLKLGEEDDR